VLLVCIAALGAAVYYYFWGRADAQTDVAAASKAKGKGKGKGGPGAGRPVPIVAAPARTADVGVYLSGLGTVTPLHTVAVRSRVDGELIRVAFREGQIVRAGELLAQIDPRPFQVQLEQAVGQLAKDQALLKNAMVDLERYRTLFEQDSIAKQQLDTQAALVRQYEGTIKADQGAVDNAKLQLTYARITAPLAGRVGLRQVDPGNIVRAADANGIVVITQLQPISVIFTIPEDSVSGVMRRLKAGERLPVDAWDRADKNKLATGTLTTLDNQIDPATGTLKLRATFSNSDFQLFPNQFVNARMLIDTLQGATVIPNAAVQRGNQGTFVYVVQQDNSVTVRPVKLGPVQGEIVAVDAGVQPGEVVVTDGADRLREGAKVELADRTQRPDRAGKGGVKGKGGGKSRAEGAAPGGSGASKGGPGDASSASPPTSAAENDASKGTAGATERPPRTDMKGDGAWRNREGKGEGGSRRKGGEGGPPAVQ
jgi:multidrug efflux system membrane fusion protein